MSLIVCSIVKNEAENLLPQALECWKQVADRLICVDNASTDGTRALLEAAGAEIHDFAPPMDGAEVNARAFLWEKAIQSAHDGDWLLWLDADQCFAGDPRPFLAQTLVNRVVFPVFDMWNHDQYRSDAWWRVRPWWQGVRMVSVARETTWEWPNRGWHSGHVPLNAPKVFGPSRDMPWECGILHYGYATPELRCRHAQAYVNRAAVLTPSERFHAGTILDKRPRLMPLPFEPKWRLL